MRDPEGVTREEFLHAVARVPSDSWKHMLSVRDDGVPHPGEELWGSFEDARGTGPLGDPSVDEDEDDTKAREEWLRELMTILSL